MKKWPSIVGLATASPPALLLVRSRSRLVEESRLVGRAAEVLVPQNGDEVFRLPGTQLDAFMEMDSWAFQWENPNS